MFLDFCHFSISRQDFTNPKFPHLITVKTKKCEFGIRCHVYNSSFLNAIYFWILDIIISGCQKINNFIFLRISVVAPICVSKVNSVQEACTKCFAVHTPYRCHYKPALDLKPHLIINHGFFLKILPCLVHKLSVIVTTLDYKPPVKNGVKNIQAAAYDCAYGISEIEILQST